MVDGKQPQLTVHDAFELLSRLEQDELSRVVLVGGQAAALWASRYRIADPSLMTTKDIDVLFEDKDGRIVAAWAKRLNGSLQVARGARVPEAASIILDYQGQQLTIDFLRALHGLKSTEVNGTKLEVTESGKTIFVMHPVFTMASRLVNTFELEGRRTDENLKRLRFSVQAVHAHLLEELSSESCPISAILQSIERIYDVAKSRAGLAAWGIGIDIFESAPVPSADTPYPEQFIKKRYPQMLRALAKERSKTRGLTRHSAHHL